MPVSEKSKANLILWQKGQSGNPHGAKRGIVRLIREALEKHELCDAPTPKGRTVAECLAEAMLSHAIKGNPAYMKEILDRIEGKLGAETDPDERGVMRPVFEVIDDGRNGSPSVQPAGGAEAIPVESR